MPASPQVEIYPDPPALFQAAAERFVQIANDAVSARGEFFIALAGGNTPRDFYRLLAAEKWRLRVPWQNTQIFFGDERCVPPDYPESNFRMAREALLDHLKLPAPNVHRMAGEQNPQRAAAAYEAEILRSFAERGFEQPRFDLILLGLGNDGHTASLFADTEALHEKTKLVVAHEVAKLNTRRLTMTLPLLNLARHVLFLVSGEGKRAIVEEIFKNTTRSFRYPAERVVPDDGRVMWMLDRAAAVG